MPDMSSWVDIQVAVVIDLLVICLCTVLLLKYARLSHSHPGTIYLFFHVYTFTFRLIGVSFGAPTMFSQYMMFFEPVTLDEMVRAGLIGDASLIAMTIGWMRASVVDLRQTKKLPHQTESNPKHLKLRHIWTVVVVIFPLGLWGLWAFSSLPGLESGRSEFGEWQGSSWLLITQVWSGLALLALIYWYGFRWWLASPMFLYLLMMAIQGYHRFRVIIPALLLIQIYLDRKKLKWPPIYVTALLLGLIVIFFPLKDIGRMTQEGENLGQIVDTSRESVNEAMYAAAPDQMFLDEFACALTLIDEHGEFYYGRTYLNVITLPIPRQWWPDKPTLADYLKDISKPWRPMAQMGMIVTFLGESYANFGVFGTLAVPFLVAYWLGRAHFKAYRSDFLSVTRFVYLLVACNLIQVYRDGLVSIIVFTLVNMMPMMLIVLLHYIGPANRVTKSSGYVPAEQAANSRSLV
jgi:hypothetical protein